MPEPINAFWISPPALTYTKLSSKGLMTLPAAERNPPSRYLTTFAGDLTYRVELARRAARDLASLYEEKHADEFDAAARWFNGLEKAVGTLENLPRRCPAAPESRKTGRQLRHLLYGRKPHVYRVIFEIDETQKVVRVLTIRHGARQEFNPADLM